MAESVLRSNRNCYWLITRRYAASAVWGRVALVALLGLPTFCHEGLVKLVAVCSWYKPGPPVQCNVT